MATTGRSLARSLATPAHADFEREWRALAAPQPSPEWVPDSDSPTCAACDGRFGLIHRRHHCRACGTVVCAACSPHRLALAGATAAAEEEAVAASVAAAAQRVRVCTPCFEAPYWTSSAAAEVNHRLFASASFVEFIAPAGAELAAPPAVCLVRGHAHVAIHGLVLFAQDVRRGGASTWTQVVGAYLEAAADAAGAAAADVELDETRRRYLRALPAVPHTREALSAAWDEAAAAAAPPASSAEAEEAGSGGENAGAGSFGSGGGGGGGSSGGGGMTMERLHEGTPTVSGIALHSSAGAADRRAGIDAVRDVVAHASAAQVMACGDTMRERLRLFYASRNPELLRTEEDVEEAGLVKIVSTTAEDQERHLWQMLDARYPGDGLVMAFDTAGLDGSHPAAASAANGGSGPQPPQQQQQQQQQQHCPRRFSNGAFFLDEDGVLRTAFDAAAVAERGVVGAERVAAAGSSAVSLHPSRRWVCKCGRRGEAPPPAAEATPATAVAVVAVAAAAAAGDGDGGSEDVQAAVPALSTV